jgi:pimeloyl-ACP methyl ester carboxylesterase
MKLQPKGMLQIDGQELEYLMLGPGPDEAPTIVLLHEGLGSAALWYEFPQKLQEETGAGVFVYSRAGYGASSPAALPRSVDFMHREALDVLPKVLDAIGFRRGLLLGHSDGASIATIYAGGIQDHRIRGLVLIAPHFINEDMCVQEIRKTKQRYETDDLRQRLSRWHSDVDNAFNGWADVWLNPEFRDFDISESLAYVRVPVAIIQGSEDPYGSVRQIEIAEEECYCPVEVTLVDRAGHAPQREASVTTFRAISAFANRLLRTHGEASSQAA